MLEPISPELVLVDPVLGGEVRARLLLDLQLEALAEPLPKRVEAGEPGPPRKRVAMPLSEALHRPGTIVSKPRKRRLAPALLSVSLALNVILIALSVSDARVARTSPSPPLAIDTTAPNQLAPAVTAPTPSSTKKSQRRARTAKPAATVPVQKTKQGARRPSARAREMRGKVEQRVLAGKLPRALIDSTTGLAKNGLQAYCGRENRSPSFLCVVRPARHKPREGLYVRYWPTRKGPSVFTWYPYRSG